jgi:hypothetical protein
MRTVLAVCAEIDALAGQNGDLAGQVASLSAAVARIQQRRACAPPGGADSEPGSRKLGRARRNRPSLSTPDAAAFFNLDAESSLLLDEAALAALPSSVARQSVREGLREPAPKVSLELHHDRICARLREDLNGNPAEMGVLTIRGNSCDAGRDEMLPKLVDYSWEKCWVSRNEPQSWVSFDFGTTAVLIDRYSIKTYRMPKGFSHLKSWLLQASFNDGLTWEELDRREGLNDLNGKGITAMFVVQKPKTAHLVRILQIGPNHAGDDYLILTNVEFYGSIMNEA